MKPLLLVCLSAILVSLALKDCRAEEESTLLRAAIFVQNNAGEKLDDKLEAFRDYLASNLSSKGFSILDPSIIIKKFEESKTNKDSVDSVLEIANKVNNFQKSESSIETVMQGASALRLAQLIDAQYLVIATLSSVGQQKRSFKGEGTLYGTNNELTIQTLRTSIRVLEGYQGGSVYGDTISVSKRYGGVSALTVESDDDYNALIEEAAQVVAQKVGDKVKVIKKVKVDHLESGALTVTSNVDGAAVSVDGVVIGTAPGTFEVRPGIHNMSVSKEWYTTWQRMVNIGQKELVVNVTLERSKEGLQRYKEELDVKRHDELERKTTEAEIAIAKEQSEAEAYSKKAISEGERELRKNSYTKIEGEIDSLSIESRPDAVIKVERE